MIRTAVTGLLFVLLMMLGMKAPSSQPICTLNCSTTCLMLLLQPPTEGLAPDIGSERQRGIGRLRPERLNQKGEGRATFAQERQITPEMVENIMAVARDIDPELADQLSSMCEIDPEALNRIIRRQGHRLGSLINLRESDPELYKVKVTELKTDAEIFHIARKLRGKKLDDPEIQGKIAQLEGLVRAKTEMSIRAQELYISRLERHLAGLRERLEVTASRVDSIVEKRISQLLEVVEEEPRELTTQND